MMTQFKKFAPYVVVLVMVLVAAGYAVGKQMAVRDNAGDAVPSEAVPG
jgi:hypothetical protein